MSPVRRVRRVIRKIDPWTVLKVSLVFNAIASLAFVLGSLVFWSVFVNAGIPEKITDLAEQLTLSFEADGPTYFRVVLLLSIIWAVSMTGLSTLAALLYNLISDIVGGIEVVVLEETLAMPRQQTAAPARRVRRAVFRRKQAEQPEGGAEPASAASKPKQAKRRMPSFRRPKETVPGPEPTAPPVEPIEVSPAAGGAPPAVPVEDLPTVETPIPVPTAGRGDAGSPNGDVAASERSAASPQQTRQ